MTEAIKSPVQPGDERAVEELAEALRDVLRCFDIKEGLSLRDEQAIKHGAAILAKYGGRT